MSTYEGTFPHMTLSSEYSRVAQRSVQAADRLHGGGLQECGAFYAYHSFESIGSALIVSHGRRVPKDHKKKINSFMRASRGRSYQISVAVLAQQLTSLRNKLLYPKAQSDGSILRPEDVLTAAQAKELMRRVRGLVRRVKRDL